MAAVHPLASWRDFHAANDAAIDPLTPTVFHEHWWLDTVCRGAWEAAEVSAAGRTVGWMPYAITRRRGFKVSVMPPLTHLLGPVVDAGRGGGNTRWLKWMGLAQELIAQLPACAFFCQTFHPGIADVLPFQSRGFESFAQFTAEVAPDDEAALWSRLRDKTRNVIRRAQEHIRVDAIDDPHEFAGFYVRNLSAAGERSYFDTSLLAPLFDAARSRHQARILAAREPGGQLAAAVFYVWDRARLWYFLSTRDPRSPHNGAVALLVWRGLQMAAQQGVVFDFDGIAGEGTSRFYSGFGAQVRPRLAVWRSSRTWDLFRAAIGLARRTGNRNTFVAP